MTDTLHSADFELLEALDFSARCDLFTRSGEQCPNPAAYTARIHAASRTGRWEGCRFVTLPVCQSCIDIRLSIPLPISCGRCDHRIQVRRDWINDIQPL